MLFFCAAEAKGIRTKEGCRQSSAVASGRLGVVWGISVAWIWDDYSVGIRLNKSGFESAGVDGKG